MVYLVEKYGKDDALYPKDVETKAIINQYFYFDMGPLYSQFAEIYVSRIEYKQNFTSATILLFNKILCIYNGLNG